MANFFKPSSKKQSSGKLISVEITRLDPNGCGVGTYQNKPVFIENTLVNEKVTAKVTESKNKFIKASLSEVVHPSPFRITPACKHFRQCGGCDIQHLNSSEHMPFKQQKLTDLFTRHQISDLLPWNRPVVEQDWHYRRKARIGVQYNKLGEPIVGFRQKKSNTLVRIKHCPVLVEKISHIFPVLEKNISELSLSKSVGHIEVIYTQSVSIIVRQLLKLNEHDKQLWLACAKFHQWSIYIDDGKNILPLNQVVPLSYQLLAQDEKSNHQSLTYNVNIQFEPNDFIQVNHQVNQKMVYQALQWLALSDDDYVLDLFCGLGNFSLPIAQIAHKVVGVEGMQSMVNKAAFNAKANGVSNASFFQADLNSEWANESWAKINYTKLLLDPARAGAYEALKQLLPLNINTIVYVSCDPTSLAKDSRLLIKSGYIIEKIAIMDMFVQTKHIETMVLFSKL